MVERDPEKDRGLYRKYEVRRVEDPAGKHEQCFYYVLDLVHDPIALEALSVYARIAREHGYESLADDLDNVVHSRRLTEVN